MTFKKKRSFRQPKAVTEFKTSDMSSGNKWTTSTCRT
jgi:hypothetical protein